MLVNHDIRSITDLLNYSSSQEEMKQQIEDRQQYMETRMWKASVLISANMKKSDGMS